MKGLRGFFKGFGKGFHAFGEKITAIINFVLLLIVYLIGVGITSMIAKITGRKFLDMDKRDDKTYWSELNLRKKPIKEYYRQF